LQKKAAIEYESGIFTGKGICYGSYRGRGNITTLRANNAPCFRRGYGGLSVRYFEVKVERH
jgi:hypothetical protein